MGVGVCVLSCVQEFILEKNESKSDRKENVIERKTKQQLEKGNHRKHMIFVIVALYAIFPKSLDSLREK